MQDPVKFVSTKAVCPTCQVVAPKDRLLEFVSCDVSERKLERHQSCVTEHFMFTLQTNPSRTISYRSIAARHLKWHQEDLPQIPCACS